MYARCVKRTQVQVQPITTAIVHQTASNTLRPIPYFDKMTTNALYHNYSNIW